MCLRQDFRAGMLHQHTHTQLHRVGGIPVRECSLMMFLFHFFLLLVMSNHLTRFGSAVPDRHSRRHGRSGCAAEPNWIIVHNICIDKHRHCLRNAFVFTTCFGKTQPFSSLYLDDHRHGEITHIGMEVILLHDGFAKCRK